MSMSLAVGRCIQHKTLGRLAYLGPSTYKDDRRKTVSFKKFVRKPTTLTGLGDIEVFKTDEEGADLLGKYECFVICTQEKPVSDIRLFTIAEGCRIKSVFDACIPDEPADPVTWDVLEECYLAVTAGGTTGTPSTTTTTAPASTAGGGGKVDVQPEPLLTLEQHEDWVKDIKKWHGTYKSRLEESDVIFRVEKSVKVKDIKDVLREETFTTLQEVLDAVEKEVNPAKDNKKWDDYQAYNQFEGSCKQYLQAENAFKKQYDKVKLLTVEEMAGMTFLKGIKAEMTAWEFKAIMRELKGNYDIKLVMKECKSTFVEDLDFDGAQGSGETVNALKGKGKGKQGGAHSSPNPNPNSTSGCLNCGDPAHWVQQCSKPLSQKAVQLLFKGNAAVKQEENKKNQQTTGGNQGQQQGGGKGGKKGKGKGKKGDKAVVVGEIG